MKIIFFGTPDFVVPIIESLQKHFEVVAVVTAPDKKVGRKQILTPSPVNVYATENNIPVLQPEKLNNFPLSEIEKFNADVYVVAAYGKIIPKAILDLPKHGAINIHPSLLPAYRGPTPIQSALRDGVKESGVSIMLMDAQMDHGPLLQTIPFTFSQTDTSEWLLKSMFRQSATVLPSVIERFVRGELEPIPQDDTRATYSKILTKQDGYIDLSYPQTHTALEIGNWKLEIARKIRAYYPWPNVWTTVQVHGKEQRIKLLPSSSHPELVSGSPILIQMEGKQAVSLKDFLNGYPELREVLSPIYPEDL